MREKGEEGNGREGRDPLTQIPRSAAILDDLGRPDQESFRMQRALISSRACMYVCVPSHEMRNIGIKLLPKIVLVFCC